MMRFVSLYRPVPRVIRIPMLFLGACFAIIVAIHSARTFAKIAERTRAPHVNAPRNHRTTANRTTSDPH